MMSNEIRIAITVRLPDEPTGAAPPAKTVLLAWEAFTAAIKGTDVIANEFYLGPQKQRRRRKKATGGPRLAAVGSNPPDTAA